MPKMIFWGLVAAFALSSVSDVVRGQAQPTPLQARTGLLHQISPVNEMSGPRSFPGPVTQYHMSQDQGSLALAVGGSVLLGTAVALVGGLVGGALSDDCDEFLCELEGAAIGFLIATPIGTAAGAHIGNGGRGNFGIDLLGAVAGTGVAITVWSGDSDSFLLFLLGAIPAVGFPVLAERWSARRKAERRVQSIALLPTPDGAAFSVSLSLNSR